MDKVKLGLRLRKLRHERGYGLRELHRESGIALSALHRWETGQIIPSLPGALKLADFYGITLDKLVGTRAILAIEQMNPSNALAKTVYWDEDGYVVADDLLPGAPVTEGNVLCDTCQTNAVDDHV